MRLLGTFSHLVALRAESMAVERDEARQRCSYLETEHRELQRQAEYLQDRLVAAQHPAAADKPGSPPEAAAGVTPAEAAGQTILAFYQVRSVMFTCSWAVRANRGVYDVRSGRHRRKWRSRYCASTWPGSSRTSGRRRTGKERRH
jgi:hypothetical protein